MTLSNDGDGSCVCGGSCGGGGGGYGWLGGLTLGAGYFYKAGGITNRFRQLTTVKVDEVKG